MSGNDSYIQVPNVLATDSGLNLEVLFLGENVFTLLRVISEILNPKY